MQVNCVSTRLCHRRSIVEPSVLIFLIRPFAETTGMCLYQLTSVAVSRLYEDQCKSRCMRDGLSSGPTKDVHFDVVNSFISEFTPERKACIYLDSGVD